MLRVLFISLDWLDRPFETILHGPPMSVDKTNFGSCSIITPTFIGYEETSCYWSVKRYQFFSAFHLSTSDPPPTSQRITVQ